jgi:hypothetical protein
MPAAKADEVCLAANVMVCFARFKAVLCRLLTHNPPDCLHSVSVFYATSLISYAT